MLTINETYEDRDVDGKRGKDKGTREKTPGRSTKKAIVRL
jgi:hypothetical protein